MGGWNLGVWILHTHLGKMWASERRMARAARASMPNPFSLKCSAREREERKSICGSAYCIFYPHFLERRVGRALFFVHRSPLISARTHTHTPICKLYFLTECQITEAKQIDSVSWVAWKSNCRVLKVRSALWCWAAQKCVCLKSKEAALCDGKSMQGAERGKILPWLLCTNSQTCSEFFIFQENRLSCERLKWRGMYIFLKL